MPTVEANGVETYYEDYGEGRPLVVLHGAFADHQVWAEQLRPLSDEYRVIPYDLRGHGKTGESDRDAYIVKMYADELAAFVDALGLERPVVLGHSLGGMVGYAFAEEYPDKLSALITVGAKTPKTFSTSESLYMLASTRILLPAMGNERLVNGLVWLQGKLLGDESTADVDGLQQLREAHDCDVPDLSVSERSKIAQAARKYTGSGWSRSLSDTPVLMLYGENEPFIEPHADYLSRSFDDCRTAEIPDASHNSQVDNPEFIRTRVREFLERTTVDRTSVTTKG